jgi:hypothetical protein
MWLTAVKSGQNRICYSSSANADSWSPYLDTRGIRENSYSPCVEKAEQLWHMWYCSVFNGISSVFHSTSENGLVFTGDTSRPAFETEQNLNTPCVITVSSGNYRMYYTKYTNGVASICSRSSTDRGIWSEESVEMANALNPCVIHDHVDGYATLRMFYNRNVLDQYLVFSSWMSPSGWQSVITGEQTMSNAISGNIVAECSKFGKSGRIEIDLINTSVTPDLTNAKQSDILLLRMEYRNNATSKDYMVQSEWLSGTEESVSDSDMTPDKFSYDAEIKHFNYGDKF